MSIEGRTHCPDGTELEVVEVYDSGHAEARCGSCGARYQVHGKFAESDAAPALKTSGRGVSVVARCPYDNGSLLMVHDYTYAGMARYKCEMNHCLFEIVQRPIAQ